MANLQSREKVAERLWDWEFLNSALPGAIRPMDIDGVVEINGNFLILEAKPLGKEIPTGQMIALQNASQKPDFHVLILYGEPSTPEKMRLLGHQSDPVNCSIEDVSGLVQRWAQYAKGNDA